MLFLHGIFNSIWIIEGSYANNYLPVVANYLNGRRLQLSKEPAKPDFQLYSFHNGIHTLSGYGNDVSPESAPENSVAIIRINGAITKYDQDCGPAGMATKANLLKRCYNNPNIKGIVLSIDSGGGEGYAGLLMQEAISGRNKGVAAFVDDFACSAAYGIAAACDTITLNNALCEVGSVGTYCTVVDYAGYWEKQGIKLIEVYASKSKDKNRDYYEALKGNLEPLRKRCDTFNEEFIRSIAKFREGKIAVDESVWATGKVFYAPEALQLGLADEIGTLDDVVNYFNI
jgi:protease-4